MPEHFCKGFQVEYASFSDNKNYRTKVYNEEGKETSFVIGEKFEHEIGYLTEEDINFFLTNKICFKVYAYETVEIREKKGIPSREEIQKSIVQFDINQKNEDDKNEDKKEKRSKVMKKFNTSGNLRKTLTRTSKTIKNLKDKDCLIF